MLDQIDLFGNEISSTEDTSKVVLPKAKKSSKKTKTSKMIDVNFIAVVRLSNEGTFIIGNIIKEDESAFIIQNPMKVFIQASGAMASASMKSVKDKHRAAEQIMIGFSKYLPFVVGNRSTIFKQQVVSLSFPVPELVLLYNKYISNFLEEVDEFEQFILSSPEDDDNNNNNKGESSINKDHSEADNDESANNVLMFPAVFPKKHTPEQSPPPSTT